MKMQPVSTVTSYTPPYAVNMETNLPKSDCIFVEFQFQWYPKNAMFAVLIWLGEDAVDQSALR